MSKNKLKLGESELDPMLEPKGWIRNWFSGVAASASADLVNETPKGWEI